MTEDIIRKIAGLLATAESYFSTGNEEAADAYISKAHELQTKYNIDQTMLAARGDAKAADKIIQKRVMMSGTYGRRRIHLAHYIARANDCTGYFERNTPCTVVTDPVTGTERRIYDRDAPLVYSYTIFGFSRDVEWTCTLAERLNTHLSANLVRDMKSRPSWESHRTWGTVYVENYAAAVSNRLYAAKQEARQAAEREEKDRLAKLAADADTDAEAEAILDAAKSTSVSLVLTDKKKRVEEEYKARHGGGRSSSTSSGYSSSAASAGRAAGNSANLGRSVGGGSAGSLGR